LLQPVVHVGGRHLGRDTSRTLEYRAHASMFIDRSLCAGARLPGAPPPEAAGCFSQLAPSCASRSGAPPQASRVGLAWRTAIRGVVQHGSVGLRAAGLQPPPARARLDPAHVPGALPSRWLMLEPRSPPFESDVVVPPHRLARPLPVGPAPRPCAPTSPYFGAKQRHRRPGARASSRRGGQRARQSAGWPTHSLTRARDLGRGRRRFRGGRPGVKSKAQRVRADYEPAGASCGCPGASRSAGSAGASERKKKNKKNRKQKRNPVFVALGGVGGRRGGLDAASTRSALVQLSQLVLSAVERPGRRPDLTTSISRGRRQAAVARTRPLRSLDLARPPVGRRTGDSRRAWDHTRPLPRPCGSSPRQSASALRSPAPAHLRGLLGRLVAVNPDWLRCGGTCSRSLAASARARRSTASRPAEVCAPARVLLIAHRLEAMEVYASGPVHARQLERQF